MRVEIDQRQLADAFSGALRDMAQRPDGIQLLQQAGVHLFGPTYRPRIWEELERFVAKAQRLPVKNIAVGTAAVQLAERDPARVQLLIANLGAATVYIGQTRQVSVGAAAGDPDGGWPVLQQTIQTFDKIVSEVWAISGTAGQDVRVLDLSGG